MLVLTRKKDEGIVIGDNIEISVVKIEDGSVKLAIKAPNDVSILRKELVEEVKNENNNAINIDLEVLKNFK
ncbi:carbon storage regulator CsrA [Clostridium mediterraneense]|uniref:carbon storage regulator CsrA n=1 Tax=Clostridium mediterraneense TaxID=1805472 RepID=UPI0008303594|nr:carbon storage regulator CsrA [Clostridium mediterraneense]